MERLRRRQWDEGFSAIDQGRSRDGGRQRGGWPVAVAALILIAAAAALLAADDDAQLPVGKTILDVRVQGNQRVPAIDILGQVQSRAGQPFTREQVQEDQRNIFSLGRFDEVRPEAEVVKDGVILTFHVSERPIIGSLEFSGVRSVKLSEVEAEAGLNVGGFLDPSRLTMARESILRLYQSKGFYFAEVTLDRDGLRQGRVAFSIREGPKVRVRKIVFRGNACFDTGELNQHIETKKYIWIFSPGALDEQTLKADVVRLLQFYRDEGFLDAEIGYTLEFSNDQKKVTVVFLINEGVRYCVGSVRFEGNSVVAAHELRGIMLLQEGRPFRAEFMRHDVKAIREEIYGQKGYINAAVDITSRFADQPAVVNLIVRVAEGRQVFTGLIDIVGNEATHEKVIRRSIIMEPSTPYNVLDAQESRNRLMATQLFSKVEITPAATGEGDFRDVLVMVEEARTTTFLVGLGVSSDAGLLGNVSLENRNFDLFGWPKELGQLFTGKAFKGAGQTLRLVAEPGTEINRFQLQFYEPYFLDKEVSLGSNLFFFTRPRDAYDESRVGYILSLGQRFRRYWSLEESFGVEGVNISDVDSDAPSDILDVEGQNLLIRGKFTIAHDTTDNRFLPTRGERLALSIEPTGGSSTFVRLFGSYRIHRTVRTDIYDRKSVVSGRVDLGYIAGDAPVFERFYAGGISSLRGFAFRGVGPVAGVNNDPVGGNFLFLAGAEYSFPLWGKSQGVLFIDTGTVEETASVTNYRASIGAEVRIPIEFFGSIPLTFGVGIPILKAEHDQDQIFHFLFGTSF